MNAERERIPIAFSSADITLFKTTSILVLRYLQGVVGSLTFFPPPSFPPLKIPEFAPPPHSLTTTTTTSTQTVLITADLHVCSAAVRAEMKQNSQWLPLHSFPSSDRKSSTLGPRHHRQTNAGVLNRPVVNKISARCWKDRHIKPVRLFLSTAPVIFFFPKDEEWRARCKRTCIHTHFFFLIFTSKDALRTSSSLSLKY